MSQAETPLVSSVVAVYPDHPSAERAVRLLHKEGFALGDLSIVGRDFQTTEEPYGFVSLGDYAKAGAGTGALFGGLFGLFVGAGFLILPGLGVVVVAGPIAAAFLAGIEGGFAGTLLGGLAGALIGWGVPRDRGAQIRNARQGGQVPRPRAPARRSSLKRAACSLPGVPSTSMSTIRHRPDRRDASASADRARSIQSWEYLWFMAFFCLLVDEPPVGPLANTKTLLTSDPLRSTNGFIAGPQLPVARPDHYLRRSAANRFRTLSTRTVVDLKLIEAKMIIPRYTIEDLKKLPFRALAAFAARCARRVRAPCSPS